MPNDPRPFTEQEIAKQVLADARLSSKCAVPPGGGYEVYEKLLRELHVTNELLSQIFAKLFVLERKDR